MTASRSHRGGGAPRVRHQLLRALEIERVDEIDQEKSGIHRVAATTMPSTHDAVTRISRARRRNEPKISQRRRVGAGSTHFFSKSFLYSP